MKVFFHVQHLRAHGLTRLRLVGRHQRTSAGVTKQHNGFHALHFAEPADSDTDVDERVVEHEAALVTAEPRVPTEEADAAGGHVISEVVLGKVDLIVHGDHRDLGLATHPAVIQPLTRMATRTGPSSGGGVQADELARHSRCGGRRCPCHVVSAPL